jgi:hypothetical protein
MSTHNDPEVPRRAAITQDDTRTVFGQVTAPVALTVGGAELAAPRWHRLGALHRRLRVHARAMRFRPTLAAAAS